MQASSAFETTQPSTTGAQIKQRAVELDASFARVTGGRDGRQSLAPKLKDTAMADSQVTTAYHFVGATLRDGTPVPPNGEWLEFKGNVRICHSGLHASRDPFDALQYAPGATLCKVEVEDVVDEHDDKLVCRRRRIVGRIDATELLRYFARMQAVSCLDLWQQEPPQAVLDYLMIGDPTAEAAEAARAAREAARAAAAAEAAEAARAAARAAAWAPEAARAAAAEAAEAAEAAREAARAAAWAAEAARAASEAAWAAEAAARAAAREMFNQLVAEADWQ